MPSDSCGAINVGVEGPARVTVQEAGAGSAALPSAPGPGSKTCERRKRRKQSVALQSRLQPVGTQARHRQLGAVAYSALPARRHF